jgi:hypothetical protein
VICGPGEVDSRLACQGDHLLLLMSLL